MIRPDLQQQLVLAKFMLKWLEEVRTKQLLPQAEAELDAGERFSVKFANRRAAWLTVPKKYKKTTVTDLAAYKAWVDANYPGEIEDVATVKVDAALIEFLREHRPGSVTTVEEVRPGFTAIVVKELEDKGYHTMRGGPTAGELVTSVPGLTTELAGGTPSVTLDKDAADVIGAVWPELDWGSTLLALPAGGQTGDVAA